MPVRECSHKKPRRLFGSRWADENDEMEEETQEPEKDKKDPKPSDGLRHISYLVMEDGSWKLDTK